MKLGIRCWNWIFYNELASAVELCVVQQNYDSQPKSCWLQRISIRCRIVCFVANCDSLPKLCRLQRINNSLPSGVFCSELTIRCRSWVGCSEIVIRCQNYGCLQQTSSRCQSGQPTANQFSLPISTISLLGRNDLNASNNFMVWWCKMWNTWMWTYELLK